MFGKLDPVNVLQQIVNEYEAYNPNQWDSETGHCPVEFVGTRKECEDFILVNYKANTLRVRRTGRIMRVPRV